jgi:hypothetical protein
VRRAAEIVRASGLDWTLVRVAKVNDNDAAGQVKAGYYGHGAVGLSTRAAERNAVVLDGLAGRGLPACAPLRTASGEAVLHAGVGDYLVSPWAAGLSPARDGLVPG